MTRSGTAALERCGEWVGAAITLPSYVTGEGAPFRPTAMMWVEVETGWVLGTELVRPDEVLARAAGLFHLATREPAMGRSRIPSRLRVADPTFAAALRGSIRDVEIVVAPTPEIDEVVASMREHFAGKRRDDEDRDEELTHIGPDMSAEDVGAMFAAAATLYRSAPWNALPSDMFVRLECAGLGPDPGAICVVGQMGESYGFSLFRTVADAEVFTAAVEANQPGEQLRLPQHVMFNFDNRREVPTWAVEEIAKYRWEVAGPDAYPRAVMIDPDMVARGLTRDETRTVTEIMIAVAELVTAKRQELIRLEEVMEDGDVDSVRQVVHRAEVKTAWGETAIGMVAPLWVYRTRPEADDLLDAFERSPGGKQYAADAEMLCEHVETTFDVPFEAMTPDEMRALLLDVLPRQLSVEATECSEIVEALRALLAFCATRLSSAHSAACLSILTPALATKFERAMRDENKFGPAKTIIMAGIRAGFDLSSEEGVEAYLQQVVKRGPPTTKKKKAPAKKKSTPKAAKTKPARKRR
ncbi:MAG: hypothetical protein HOV81_21125 [Kofleriaceae bacterium]|nr:hypothetical protein [Kofleriaceae bacterium]